MIYPQKNVILIGNNSVGKSRLLNKLFDLKQKFGKGKTTMQFKCVHTINNKINIFDSVGYNDQSTDNVEQYRKLLAQINSCHLVFICFDGSLKSLRGLIEIVCKSKQRMYNVAFVLTKCDVIALQDAQKIPQYINAERQYLKKLGIENAYQYPFIMSSGKLDKFPGGQNENYKIIKMINGLQIKDIKDIKRSFVDQQIQIIQTLYDKNFQRSISPTKNVIFIGNVSSGKSKLLNKLFNLKLKSGKGETTLKCQCVHTIDNKINIFDSIGLCDQSPNDINQYRQQLAQINCCHLVFICFDGQLKSLRGLVQIICKARDRMYKVAFIKTKCHMIDPEQQTFAQCIEREIKYLESLGIENAKEYPIFMSSVRAANQKEDKMRITKF